MSTKEMYRLLSEAGLLSVAGIPYDALPAEWRLRFETEMSYIEATQQAENVEEIETLRARNTVLEGYAK